MKWFVILVFFSTNSYADCRDCCSGHGGVICNQQVTKCRDLTPLDRECVAKGCNMCRERRPISLPPKGKGEGKVSRIFTFEEIRTTEKSEIPDPNGNFKEVTVITKKVVLTGKKIGVELKKGESKVLENGLKVTFNGHSHKRTKAGQDSPLVLQFDLEFQGKKGSEYFHIYPGQSDKVYWNWEGFVFIHLDHEYDDYEKFEVSFERDPEAVAEHL